MPVFFSCFLKVLIGCVFLCFFFRHFNGHILYPRMPFFFSHGWVCILPFFNFFRGFFGLFPLNLAFLLWFAGYSGTEVSCTHSVFFYLFLFYVLLQHYLFLNVCYLFGVLLSVNLALYIHSSLLFSCVIGHYVTKTCVLGHYALRARRA